MRCVQIKVEGKVQGVWFRKSTQEIARMLQVNGVVKNLPDSSVYIEAEGDEESLAHFLDWCEEGPPNAIVDRMEMRDSEPKNYRGFEIED